MAPRVRLERTTYRLTAERSTDWANEEYIKSGDNLSFQQGNSQVLSALKSLTSVFGMGTGITLNVIITRKLLYAIKHTQKYIDELVSGFLVPITLFSNLTFCG